MKRSLCWLLWMVCLTPLYAQPINPAQPVDSDQAAVPAQRVDDATPAIPATPAVPATPATPATPTQPVPATPAVPVAPAKPSTTAGVPDDQVAVSIMADSSLKLVLTELAQNWADSQDEAPQVPMTLTNASTLRAKIESGTVWDVVISADLSDVKALNDKGLLFPDGQRTIARNTLVLYGRKGLVKDDDLEWFDLIGTEWKKVALGNTDLVASGRVAKRALQKHDLFDDDHKKVYIPALTEALALDVVLREKADAVFIYKTDLPKIYLPGFAVFPLKTEDAPPIFYTAAVSRLAKNPAQARAFINYCDSDAARAVWKKYGFEAD